MVATSVYPHKGSSGRTAKTIRKGLSVSKTRKTTRKRFFQYQVVRTREPASFWRENGIAVRHYATGFYTERSYQMSESSGGLTSFNKSNRVIFSGEECKMKLFGVFVFSEYA